LKAKKKKSKQAGPGERNRNHYFPRGEKLSKISSHNSSQDTAKGEGGAIKGTAALLKGEKKKRAIWLYSANQHTTEGKKRITYKLDYGSSNQNF